MVFGGSPSSGDQRRVTVQENETPMGPAPARRAPHP